MSNWIETKLKSLADRIESQLDKNGSVDRDLMDEFSTYHKVYTEYRASLRHRESSVEDSVVESVPPSKDR
jgi:hypothetical protein